MKNKIIFLLSVLSGFFLPHARGEDNAATNVAAIAPPVQQSIAAPQRGTLYRVRYQNNTAYLFGTIHIGKPTFFPLETEVTRALTHASKLVVEIDIRNSEPFQQALKKHGLYAAGDRIDQHLSAESLRRLRLALDKFGIPFEGIAHMKPWLLANMLIALDLERHGYERSHGVEYFLLSFAKEQTKIVQELESAEYQLSLYDGMTETEQEQYLREILAQIDDGNALKKAQALIDAWASANGKAFDDLLQESINEKTTSSEFMHRVLLDKRNPEMAEKIEALLKNEESTFVGVGLLHLIGETGVPKLLRQRGYEVEKLY
jgi:uncharacterized protein YbaP (TraB family)